jgi:hypothetical protein
MPAQPHANELEAAVAATGYRYTDPAADDAWPDISEYNADREPCPDDLFPPSWGATPTERDRAAIEAGNI